MVFWASPKLFLRVVLMVGSVTLLPKSALMAASTSASLAGVRTVTGWPDLPPIAFEWQFLVVWRLSCFLTSFRTQVLVGDLVRVGKAALKLCRNAGSHPGRWPYRLNSFTMNVLSSSVYL